MKILMINVVCGIRSTGRICTDLADALTEKGHTVKIAYGREEVPEKYKKYAHKIGSDFDVKMHGMKARLFDGSGFGSKRATIKFIEWVKEYDPDVVHIHNVHGYYINIEVLFNYLRTCGKKIIWTLHDCWAFTGHTAYCDAVGCERWVSGCHNCPLLHSYPKAFIDNSKENWKRKSELFSNIPNLTIITPSNWLADITNKSFLSSYPVKVIHNGIDTKRFYPKKTEKFREKNSLEDKYLILGVATVWDDMKGLTDYFRISKCLDEKYKIVLVGLSKQQLSKLPKSILGIARTNSIEELTEIYSTSNLYLNLSYCDTYPTVNIEALACGTPVMTYRTGGSPEIVEEYNGIIVEKGNVEEIIKIIVENEMPRVRNFDKSKYDYHTTLEKYLLQYS